MSETGRMRDLRAKNRELQRQVADANKRLRDSANAHLRTPQLDYLEAKLVDFEQQVRVLKQKETTLVLANLGFESRIQHLRGEKATLARMLATALTDLEAKK